MMKHIYAGLIVVLAAGFALPAFAQDAAQVARAVSPLSLAQYQDQNDQYNDRNQNDQHNNRDQNDQYNNRDHNDQRDERDRHGWRPGADWNQAIRLRCASQGYQYNMCQVDTGRGSAVRIERQISKTRCVKGRTWGFNRAGIWVDGGCEAIFRVDRRWR
jgi:Ni/Co efflux regulator RcnB